MYYFNDDETIILSSEIKSIFNILDKKRLLNKNQIDDYLNFGYIPNENEQTIYKEIKRVLPGYSAIVDLNEKNLNFKFINKNTVKNYLNLNTSNKLDELVYDSIKIRLRTDVKNAAVISGGVDSTLVSSMAHKIDKNISFVTGDSVLEMTCIIVEN